MPKKDSSNCEDACQQGRKVPLSKEEKKDGRDIAKRKRHIITEKDPPPHAPKGATED
jgi:hypothetical protein